MKPKPFSIQQRLLLIEALAMALALWVLGAVMLVGLKIRGDSDRSVTQMLYLLLVASAVLGLALLRVSRKMHRRHLWQPVAQMGQMVRQIRGGNLEVQAEIPRSVELGPLVDSFLRMAGELRAAREALEKKVARQSVELDTAQRKLLEAAKLAALGQLVSGVAHEVNNPLTSILGFAEVVLGNPSLDASSRRQLHIVRDEALRLKNVVANLSSFARRAPRCTARFDLRKVLARVAELRRYQLAASGIEFHWEPPQTPVWVEGDADHILQVLFNLLLNAEQAIKAGAEKGEIWLACHVERGEARIAVRDSGIGMPRDVLDRIFEPYFTTKPVGQGSGLGLSISHGIVAQHGGRIHVESRVGEGSVFTVALPVSTAPEAAPAPPQEAQPAPVVQARRALVIDDEADILDLLSSALERRGWQTVTLQDATRVEGTLEGSEFDLVLCDLKMPGRNGLEVRRLLEATRPELATRFLLMTGNLADADKASLDLSTVTVLRKPFTLAQLDEAIRTLDRQRESHASASRAPIERM